MKVHVLPIFLLWTTHFKFISEHLPFTVTLAKTEILVHTFCVLKL